MAVKNVTFQVTANTTQATQELAKITRALDLIQKKATIKVTADTTQASGRINNINSAITQLSRRAISLRVDTKGATAEIKRLSDSLSNTNRRTSINVQANTSQARTALQGILNLINQLRQRVTISVNTTALNNAQQQINRATQARQINFRTNASQAQQQVGGLAQGVNFVSQAVANSSNNFIRLRNVIARTGLALGAVSIGAAITSLGRAAVNAAKDYEVLKVAFTTFIGNVSLAEVKIKQLRQFAAETPFTVDEVFKASRTLLGYGIAAGDLIPIIRRLGDVAGGTGAPLERIALVFGQVRAAGRLYGQDLLQLINAGFNPLQEISRTTGKSFGQLKDEMRKGLVTFDDVNQAFISATSEGGKFFNLTNALANTTQGRLARLREEWNELLRVIGEGLLPTFNVLVGSARSVVEGLRQLPKVIEENRVVILSLTAATALFVGIRTKANQANILAAVTTAADNVVERISNGLYRIKNVLLANTTRATVGMTVAQRAQTIATNAGTIAQNAFNAAVRANPIGLLLTLLATAAAAWYAYSDAVTEAKEDVIDLNDVTAKAEAETLKNTKERLRVVNQDKKNIENTTTGTEERQKLIDKFNEANKTTIKDIQDQTQFVNQLDAAYAGLKVSIEQEEKVRAFTAGRGELEAEATKQIENILNLAGESKIEIPIELLDSKDAVETQFQTSKDFLLEEQQKINDEIKRINSLTEQELEAQFEELSKKGLARKVTLPGQRSGQTETVVFSNTQQLEQQVKVINEKLIPAINTLNQLQLDIGGVNIELEDAPETFTFDPEAEAKAEESRKKAIEQLKDFNKELLDLLDRIRKNNEDLRRQFVELNFIDAADFEEEVVKLQQLDRINEETVNREIDREIESVRMKDLTEQQKTKLIAQLEIIRNQEQQKRAFALQERLYEIERDGTIARRKLALELGALYDELISDRAQRELDALDELREQLDDFYNDIFQDDPFSKGRFITAPRIEFGGTEFQFEDIVQPPTEAIEELRKSISELNAAGADLSILSEAEFETRNQLIDEFNAEYGTTLSYVQNEYDLQVELSKEYEKRVKQAKDLYNEQNKAPRRQNIFQFARGVQERGQEDPFVKKVEEDQRTFIEASNAAEKAELTRIENARNARILLIQQTATEENKALQINIANAEFDKEADDAKEGFFQKRKERLKKDSDAIKANDAEQKKIIKEERDARIQALEDITQAVLDFNKVFIDAQIQQTEAAINAQQKRVDAAKEIADKGNVVLLKAEQERLDKLNRQRANYVRQQQNLAAVEIAVNTAIAISKAAGQPGSPFTIFALLAAMAVGFAQARAQAQSAATFAKGGYTGDGHQFQEAGTVHKGEFVMNAQRTRQYRPLLEAIHSGRHPELAKSVNEKVFVVNSKSTDERLDRIERAIVGQKGLQLSIDENGINGIVSRISYKNQRINNKAR